MANIREIRPPGARTNALLTLGCALLLAVVSTAQAQTRGNVFPPSLNYAPAAGTSINLNLSGVTGSASILVTPVGGMGTGSFATMGLSCSLTGPDQGSFSVAPSSFNFLPGSPAASIGLSCAAGISPRTATLFCNEAPGGSTGQSRSWPLQCPPLPPTTAPSLSFNPAPGSPVTFSSSSNLVGATANGSIRITPSGGFGTGFGATTQFNNCTVTGESVPGTFAGFQGASFTFVGATTAVQTLNLTATLRATAVTATLNCDQVVPGSPLRGSPFVIPRSWPLQVNAGTQPVANLRLLKTASAQQVQVNEEFSYNVQASNAGSSPEFGLIVIDQVPSALTVLSASGPDWTCRIDGNTVDCRLPELIGGRSADFNIQVRAPATPRSISNSARMTSLSNSTALVSSATVDVVAPPPEPVDLAIDKTDSADPVRTGSNFSYLLTVSNLGAGAATGVRVEDVLPAGLTLVAATGPGWTCNGSSTVSCTLAGSLAAGASASVSIEVTAPAQATNLSNRATVSSNEPDSNSANNADTESTSITAEPPPPPPLRADLGISATAVPGSVLTGQNVSFEVAINNIGPDPATAVIFDGTLSAALEALGASGNGWTCTVTARQIVCTRASIGVNATENLTISARVLPGATGSADMALRAVSSVTDPVPANNQGQVAVSYQAGGADVSIVKTDSVDPVAAGAQYSYTLTVSNAGPEAASGVVVSDTLPAALSFVSASGAGFACTNTAGTVRCTLANPLAAGASAAATIAVRAPTSGSSISNEGVVSASTNDPNQANNRSTQTTQINDRTVEQISDLLDEAAVDPASEAALPVVSAECADPASALAAVCEEIVDAADDGRIGEVTDALRAIAPDEVLAQQLVLREIATTQFFNVDARLNELRRGGGGFSLSGLTVNSGGQAIPLSLAGEALQAALGYGDDEGGLISPWGFFVNGNITDGKQDLRNASGRVGVDYSSRGITAGIDYRLSNRSVVGAALGYAKFTSDVNTGSELDAKSLLLTGYGSYYVNDRFYVDTRLTYGNVKLDQTRSIRFRVGGLQVDELARGDADSTQLTLATSMGYHLNYGAWTVTPNLGLRYIRNDVDAFTETGAGAYNVSYRDQSFKTTQLSLGVQIGRAISLDTGVLMPQFDFSLNNENSDDPQAQANLVNGSPSQLFRLDQQGTDSSYGSAGLGFVYLMANGRQAYVSYRHTFGNDDFDRGSLNLGGRFEF
ncbi:MAG: autotransporter domain-containing protein [Lysobacterales bacterium]